MKTIIVLLLLILNATALAGYDDERRQIQPNNIKTEERLQYHKERLDRAMSFKRNENFVYEAEVPPKQSNEDMRKVIDDIKLGNYQSEQQSFKVYYPHKSIPWYRNINPTIEFIFWSILFSFACYLYQLKKAPAPFFLKKHLHSNLFNSLFETFALFATFANGLFILFLLLGLNMYTVNPRGVFIFDMCFPFIPFMYYYVKRDNTPWYIAWFMSLQSGILWGVFSILYTLLMLSAPFFTAYEYLNKNKR